MNVCSHNNNQMKRYINLSFALKTNNRKYKTTKHEILQLLINLLLKSTIEFEIIIKYFNILKQFNTINILPMHN